MKCVLVNPFKSLWNSYKTAYKKCILLRTAAPALLGILTGMFLEWVIPYAKYPVAFVISVGIVTAVYVFLHDRLAK